MKIEWRQWRYSYIDPNLMQKSRDCDEHYHPYKIPGCWMNVYCHFGDDLLSFSKNQSTAMPVCVPKRNIMDRMCILRTAYFARMFIGIFDCCAQAPDQNDHAKTPETYVSESDISMALRHLPKPCRLCYLGTVPFCTPCSLRSNNLTLSSP
jgi:hypothetical protein